MTGSIARQPRLAFLALGLIGGAVLAGFVPLLSLGAGGGRAPFDPYLFHVAAFTLVQAALSTILSILAAVPMAHAQIGRAHV